MLFKVSEKSDSSLQFFLNNSETVDDGWYKYIYSESVLKYLNVYYKIKINKQCIIRTTTIVCIPFSSNESPWYYFFRRKNTSLFLQN